MGETRDAEAVRLVRCRFCGAAKGMWCIYTADQMNKRRWTSSHGYEPPTVRAAKGTPMIRVHTQRRDDADKVMRRDRRNAELVAAIASQPPWLVPLREFDQREAEAMRKWLRLNAVRLFRLRKEE